MATDPGKQINAYPAAISIDGAADYFLIDPGGTGTYNKISRNVALGVNTPVGTTDSQTLTNKTIGTSNTLTADDSTFSLKNHADATKIAVFSASGITTGTTRTYTLPNATDTLAGLAATQTLTNKTITSPTITGGTIDNSTVTVDAVSGHTVSNTGTIYGVSVATGVISTANSIAAGTIVQGGVGGTQLATSAITLGYAQITTNFTTTTTPGAVDVTGLSVTVTVPAGGRRVKVTFGCQYMSTSAGAGSNLQANIVDVTAGATIGGQLQSTAGASYGGNYNCVTTHVPAAGSRTYKIQAAQSNAGTLTVTALTTIPAFILVEAI